MLVELHITRVEELIISSHLVKTVIGHICRCSISLRYNDGCAPDVECEC